MSRLYVANCTRQFQEIYYRLDYNNKGEPEANRNFQPAKRQTIPPGRQINLGGDLHMTQINDIVEQLKPYGLVGSVDVPRLKTMAPYVFNIDQAVTADVIRNVRNVNSGILIQQGKQQRARAAIIVNETVANVVSNEFAEAGVTKEPTQDVEVEFEQQDQSEAGEKLVEEGYRIDASAPANPQLRSGKGGKGSGRRKP